MVTTMAAKKTKSLYTIDEIAALLRLKTWEKIEDENPDAWSYQWSEARRQALEEGLSEDEADEKAQEAEGEARDEDYQSWKSSVLHVAETFLGYHKMDLRQLKTKAYIYEVFAVESWNDAANAIRETINGDGIVGHCSSLKDFLYINCGTARQVTLSHLGWIKRYADVYGVASPERMMENRR